MQIHRNINELMTSNCYILWDEYTLHSIVIDPASENSSEEIELVTKNSLVVDYIILTHEHTDHTWGVNSLLKLYDAKVVCSELCKQGLSRETSAYFNYYFDNVDYSYSVSQVDFTVEELGMSLSWNNKTIRFMHTPGHSKGSICIKIDNMLFTGDTLIPYPPFFNKRGSNREEWINSVKELIELCDENDIVYPGHGDKLEFSECINLYKQYL